MKICTKCKENLWASEDDLKFYVWIHIEGSSNECALCSDMFNDGFQVKTYESFSDAISSSEKNPSQDTAYNENKGAECAERFQVKNLPGKIQSTVSPDRPHKCSKCPAKFKSKPGLFLHKRIHDKNNPYTCKKCGKKCVSSSDLSRHMISHTDSKPYVCPICQRTLKFEESLRKHMILHDDRNPFKCQICDKRWQSEHLLQVHMNFHLNIRPFKCSICDSEFNTKSNLNRHIKIHYK